jgi:hypothetical protein
MGTEEQAPHQKSSSILLSPFFCLPIDVVCCVVETGRFGGWPANHGIWSWGDEILVGFSAGYHLFARSMDGGSVIFTSMELPYAKH